MEVPSPGTAGTIETTDVAAHAEALKPWDLTMRQLSPGGFRGRIDFTRIGAMLLYRERWGKRTVTQGTLPPEYFFVAGSKPGASHLDWCGHALDYAHLATSPRGADCTVLTPEAHEHIGVLVPRRLMQRHGAAGATSPHEEDKYSLRVNAARGSRFLGMLDQTIDRYLPQSERLAHEPECRAIEVQLLDSLADLLFHADTAENDAPVSDRRVALRRALEFGHSHHQPITLFELAKAVDVHPRTLQRAFRETLHISPLKYLRLCRLDGTHRDLRAMDRQATSVAAVALKWGFTEFGRFAVEYRSIFGQHPFVTLARDHHPPRQTLEMILRAGSAMRPIAWE